MRDAFIENYSPKITAGAYVTAFESLYNAGSLNKKWGAYAKRHSFLVEQLGEDAARTIYDFAMMENIESRIKNRGKKNAKMSSGSVKDLRENVPESGDALFETAEILAKKLGIDIVLGADTGKANGEFNGNNIFVKDGTGVELRTLYHEMGEFIKAYEKQGFDDLRSSIIEWFNKYDENGFDALVKNYYETYKAHYEMLNEKYGTDRSITMGEASDEAIFDALVNICLDEKVADNFIEWAYDTKGVEAEGFIERFKQFISDFFEHLRNLIADQSFKQHGEFIANMASVEELTDIQNKVLNAIDNAAKNYRQEAYNNATAQTESEAASYSLTIDTTDAERTEWLKNKKIVLAETDATALKKVASEISVSEEKKYARELCKYFGIFETNKKYQKPLEYNYENIKIDFSFSGSGSDESLYNQKRKNGKDSVTEYYKLVSCLEETIKNAVPVYVGSDRYLGTYRGSYDIKNVYVLTSAYKDENAIVPVMFMVKEYINQDNNLYLAITAKKIEDTHLRSNAENNSEETPNVSSDEISITDLISNIKQGWFLKYFPNEMLSNEQVVEKVKAQKEEYDKYVDKKNDKRSEGKEEQYLKHIDTEYSKALKENDTDRLQRLVKDYAKTKGYVIEGYHGTRFNFDAFDRTELGKNTGTGISKEWFFAADQETAESYSPYHVIKSLEKTNPKMYPEGSADKLKNKGNLYHLGMKMDNPLYVDLSEYNYAAHRENADALLEYSKLADGLGHDGIVFYNAMDNNLKTGARESVLYLFKNGEQAKSLEPITRDKEGNVIPLSQRFDKNINNMNFSLEVDTEGNKLSDATAVSFLG